MHIPQPITAAQTHTQLVHMSSHTELCMYTGSLVPRPFRINCVGGEKGPGTHCFADVTLRIILALHTAESAQSTRLACRRPVLAGHVVVHEDNGAQCCYGHRGYLWQFSKRFAVPLPPLVHLPAAGCARFGVALP